jgi:hypothetical protein
MKNVLSEKMEKPPKEQLFVSSPFFSRGVMNRRLVGVILFTALFIYWRA